MTAERLAHLDDAYKLYRCHTIMNCAKVLSLSSDCVERCRFVCVQSVHYLTQL
jgi:succinate dehydrogenase/fumarate reductase-like Fe-S protein